MCSYNALAHYPHSHPFTPKKPLLSPFCTISILEAQRTSHFCVSSMDAGGMWEKKGIWRCTVQHQLKVHRQIPFSFGNLEPFNKNPVTFHRTCRFLHVQSAGSHRRTGGEWVWRGQRAGFILSPNTAGIPSCSDKTAPGLTDCGETDQHFKSNLRRVTKHQTYCSFCFQVF